MKEIQILKGHVSQKTAFILPDYPYRSRRTRMYCWIESVAIKGDRIWQMTINPKTNKFNAPDLSPFYPFQYLFLDEEDNVQHGFYKFNDSATLKRDFKELLSKFEYYEISDTQQINIANVYLKTFIAASRLRRNEFGGNQERIYREWEQAVIDHLLLKPFDRMADYPDEPVF